MDGANSSLRVIVPAPADSAERRTALTVNEVEEKIYWWSYKTNWVPGQANLWSSNLDGTNSQTVSTWYTNDPSHIQGMAFFKVIFGEILILSLCIMCAFCLISLLPPKKKFVGQSKQESCSEMLIKKLCSLVPYLCPSVSQSVASQSVSLSVCPLKIWIL